MFSDVAQLRAYNLQPFGHPSDSSSYYLPTFGQTNLPHRHSSHQTSSWAQNTARLNRIPQSSNTFLQDRTANPTNHAGLTILDNSEHMLRRKTPSGTLSAGYDGTLVDLGPELPAAKQLVLSRSESNKVLYPQSNITREKTQYPLRLHSSSRLQYSQTPSISQLDSQYNGSQQGRVHVQNMRETTHGLPWANYPLGVDSTIHQVPSELDFSSNRVQNNYNIPSVLQPPYQPRSGPTASNEPGPYGPYWPDGAFIPYRPAALRDPRYHQQAANSYTQPWKNQSAMNPSLQPTLHSSLASIDGTPGYSHSSVLPLPLTQFGQSHLVQGSNQYQLPAFNNHGNADMSGFWQFDYASQLLFKDQYADSTSSRNKYLPVERDNLTLQNHTQLAPESDEQMWSGNADFKDKVLSWAHAIYVDLLAFIHHSRKNTSRHNFGQGHRQRPSKTGIYPRPPRQPVLDFSSDQSYSSYRSPSRVDKHFSGQEQLLIQDQSRLLQGQNLKPQSPKYARNFGLNEHSTPVLPSQSSRQPESLSSSAMTALKMLSSLCEEGSWEWIDGMLLGGCLAYGLGDYESAMSWYLKILAKDQSNVEAMSNLAATLLSLNRRQEAEHYWLVSVKLRPSYFEAVEHLIGLLCADHRGKEAVEIIEQVEKSLRLKGSDESAGCHDLSDEIPSQASLSSNATLESFDHAIFDYTDNDNDNLFFPGGASIEAKRQPGFGTSGYAIPGSDNGRMLALVHAKGNMLYALGNNAGAAAAFEEAVLIAAGKRHGKIRGLIKRILHVFSVQIKCKDPWNEGSTTKNDPVLLLPEKALQTAKLVFPNRGELSGLSFVPSGLSKKAAISTTSNALLSLAKIYQDGIASGNPSTSRITPGVRDILALYYLSLSLQPSPSTANNVGILLASIQQTAPSQTSLSTEGSRIPDIPGVVPGSGIALALAYYNYGLNLDNRHAHLYTNLGSLLKDIGQLAAAIKMYEQAVSCDGNFDIALANLANAVKDQGRINDAITYYKRAVTVSPDFSEAVCGLANVLNSVCDWTGRGGIKYSDESRDRWHVDEKGMIFDSRTPGTGNSGLMQRVFRIVERQLKEGEDWGRGILTNDVIDMLMRLIVGSNRQHLPPETHRQALRTALEKLAGRKWEGANVVKLVERAIRKIGWQWYQDKYVHGHDYPPEHYTRPQLPVALSCPSIPTVLPFHTFTFPFSARQIRQISQRNGLRISSSTLRSPWLPPTVFKPPKPPAPHLNVGYVSSDFNNHPLAHLMQSVFGFHNSQRVKAFCYATTASDHSMHRRQIEAEAPVFYDAHSWSTERLVKQIVNDGIHILVNLNGYTRGAKNEVFAARPAPIQMSFMGFAGTLGAEWCDYLLADETAIPPQTLRPYRKNVDIRDDLMDQSYVDDQSDWLYTENIVYTRDTFFCCDHRQSAPDSQGKQFSWEEEQTRRWQMRKEIFPKLPDDAIIFGNFNQLYKIEPTTFRTWLRILDRVPNAILWLLRFPDLGEANLKRTAVQWAGQQVASRIIFTDVAPKQQHISRARVCDLFLDTPECNAHTTAADILWSGTPLLTLPRYKYKMCSRMAASILKGALPKTPEGNEAAHDLIACSEEEYEERAVRLGNGLSYPTNANHHGRGCGRLMELRRILYQGRWTSGLFDTRRWVRDLEDAYKEAWRRWEKGEGGDIWL